MTTDQAGQLIEILKLIEADMSAAVILGFALGIVFLLFKKMG